ncbi:alpha/beta fold hydrolase [Mucilaginibacter boryungensis]|uniref:Alpha/beta fold hydrolase n=1 Tax=Mucilaginibacter boryungensis TaxID=768480 RepID=A0ABR9XI66_9SPHI|nr:alpha/beta fold hydrolase [Mucilaginibacter boryungensis]MBE9667083.1 alpha/beta fold hydrolase [Mucilaginibacter boryungensis]
MKKLLPLIFTLLFASVVYAQTEPANYGVIVNKFKLFYNSNKPDSIYKIFGPEMRNALTADQFKATTAQLKTQLGALNQTTFTGFNDPIATYDAAFQNGTLTLRLSLNKAGQIIGLLLQPAQPKTTAATATTSSDPDMIEIPVMQKVFTGNIAGTLGIPKKATGKVPVVLIIAGSGPTDRDGNNPLGVSANSYKLLASALAKNGIATLRYDKRMIGQSTSNTKEADLRFDDYADDAIALIGMLHSDARFSSVFVLGHSEGSLVGMLACADQPVAGFISVAGAGERADKILTEQLKSKPQFVQDAFKVVLDSLRKGKTTDRVDPSLFGLARPSVQPYLRSWMYHEPKAELKKLKIPVLILQGTNDLQITVADAEKLKKAKSDATLVIIPGMNHVLKDAPADKDKNLETYKDPNLPIKPELVTNIVAFINKLK